MPRYRIALEYDGGAFVGWQRQDNGPSVQAAVETAVQAFCGETVHVVAAGRTDAGVHARGQVAHCDLHRDVRAETLRDAVNFHLRPLPVAVLEAEAVGDDFHARFSARRRSYRYRICNRRAPPVLDRGHAWWMPRHLDADAMAAAAKELVGRHDFTTFRSSACQATSPVRTLDHLVVDRAGDDIWLDATARSFLHHQVRNMVGTLALIGRGKWSIDDLRNALAARDRRRGGPTAPAAGLCLMRVEY